MASDNEASCESDPNFAVICAFMEKFGVTCGLASIDFLELQEMLENTQEVPQELIDLHIKLLRKSRKTVSTERWEKAIIKICHGFCVQDAWEIERFGYKKARLSSKLRVLKELLEMQFDYNARFKAEINKMSAEELRSQPLGKDKLGHAYWFQSDNNCQIRVYKEDPDEETWTLVAKDREGLVSLISELNNGDSEISPEAAINEEDSNSLAEKPIIDTGQVDTSSSDSNKKSPTESDNSNESKKEDSDVSDPTKKDNISPPEETDENNEQMNGEESDDESPPLLEPEVEPSKRPRESDDEDANGELAKRKKTEEVSEAIEEPVMLVRGEGNGVDNQCVNRTEESPIVGEEIEETVMYFYGRGSGVDCGTGNEDDAKKTETSEKNGAEKDAGVSESYVSISVKSDSKNCVDGEIDGVDGSSKEVPTSPVKSPFKLGTIIDTKTDNKFLNTVRNPAKKSRWDVETIIAKKDEEVKKDEEKEDEETTTSPPKKSMFFFGPGCLQFKPNVSPVTVAFGGQQVPQTDVDEEKFETVTKTEEVCVNEGREIIPANTKGDIGYRIQNDNKEEVEETIECVQLSEGAAVGPSSDESEKRIEETSSLDVEKETPIESRVESKLDDVQISDNNEETKASQQDVGIDREKVGDVESTGNDETIDDVLPTEPKENVNHDKEKEETEAALEEEIVSEKEACDTKITIKEDEKVPEVTAALVECNEEVKPKSTNLLEETKQETPLKEEEPVPVIEEKCVKKYSYLLGDETEASKQKPAEEEEEETKVNSIGARVKRSRSLNDKITQLKDEIVSKDNPEKISNHQPEKVLILSVISVCKPTEEPLKQEAKDNQPSVEDKNCATTEEKPETKKAVIDDVAKNEKVENKEKETTNNANNKTVRSRKNSVPDDQPKIFTRRTTRSSKNEEKPPEKTVEEKPPKLTPVKDEKSASVTTKEEKKKAEEQPQVAVQPRRGRSRGMQKVEKEEPVEVEVSKKMKLSEKQEETEAKPTRQTRNKAKEEVKRNEEAKKSEEVAKEVKKNEETVKEVKKNEETVKEVKKNEEAVKEVKKNEEAVKEVKKNEEVVSKVLVESVTIDSSSNSCDVVEVPSQDPLAVTEDEAEKKETEEKPPMSLATFSLDFTESPTPTPPLTRSGLRKRSRESPQNVEEVEETGGKRLKKGKRNIDVKLRKSIEEQKKQELISSDDDRNEKQQEQDEEKSGKKKGGKHKKIEKLKDDESVVVVSSDTEATEPPKKEEKKKTKSYNKNKRLLSNLGIDPKQILGFTEEITGVRQSRRIAQLKIKEEAERRKLEEEMMHETHKKKKSKKSEDKDYKVEKKRLKDGDEDEAAEEDSTDSKKKKKKKKKHKQLFDELNPWRSSSDSSTSDEEEEDEIGEESDDDVLQYVSDHEFSPESDLEADGEALPLKRARTARKESDVEEVDDCPCQKCGKSDHPEWILLCDKCDNGWHCSCLRPPLLVIPEGDWFCPPCQHVSLLRKLQEKLKEYDKTVHKKELEIRRKQRLAYVGISLNSVLPAKETEVIKKRRRSHRPDDEDESSSGDESESGSESGSASESGSDSDEPIYQLRQRRQAHSYRFNDYDELINSAIQEEMDAVKGAGNQGRGKDIATIVNAEKEEERKKESSEVPGEEQTQILEPLPPVVPPNDKDKEAKPLYSDDEPVQGVKKKLIGRKKHRKLNSLDISSADDDEDSDEDFKGTSTESDDDFDDDLGSEDSDDLDTGRNRRKNMDPVRRSTRARTSRYDADFIDDGDSEDEDEAPRRKKKRSYWDDTESEESDRSWGRRKRKPASKSKKNSNTSKKKKSKKKKKDEDSDAEVYRKKKPKIKFGLDGEDEGPGRRTRGKKINYVDALGSDSEEDRVKRPPPRIESEEEYVANEEDELDEDDKVSEEESGEDATNAKAPKVQIQSYADAGFTQLLPEGVPTPKDLFLKNQVIDDGDDEPNPIDQINRNVEMMDENEMEKMMEEEEYANKQLQLVALQLEKEKRRKEREAKKLEGLIPVQLPQQPQQVQQQPPQPVQQQPQQDLSPKKRGRKPKNQFQFSGPMHEPIVGNVDNLLVNSENNDELSEPPGVSLPLFAELGTGGGEEDPAKKRRMRGKKSLEEAVANLGSVRQQQEAYMAMSNKATDLSVQESNIEIAAPPQPFSQSQPTPSVITRMLQSKPGQPGYPIGTIRPKQFAAMSERDEEVPTSHHSMSPAPAHHGQYMQGSGLRPQLSSPYRQLPPNMNHYPRGGAPPPPHQIRNPVPQALPSHIYHTHRPMDPSPSGGGTITMPEHSPGRVVSPAASSPGSNKNETPPPPYTRPGPPPVGGRFPMINTTANVAAAAAGPRHMHMVAPHLQPPPRPNLSPYHPSMPPSYHYGQFGQPPMGGTEDAMPPTVYQNSPYSDQFPEGQVNPSENSNSKSFDEESGGEFGGLVSYFSSQREDDLES